MRRLSGWPTKRPPAWKTPRKTSTFRPNACIPTIADAWKKPAPMWFCCVPPPGSTANGWRKVAPYNTHILVEKPFAASLADADRMIAAMNATGKTLVINWPLAWYPPHITTKRLIAEGAIGTVREVHYYDGNRGPLRHIADKIEISAEEAARQKSQSWWYQQASGGGSLLDYLGYGVTLGTWFHNGNAPLEVVCMTDAQPGLEVDEHSITLCRYDVGLSKYETRWGTFTDPWTLQPQPEMRICRRGHSGNHQQLRLRTRHSDADKSSVPKRMRFP